MSSLFPRPERLNFPPDLIEREAYVQVYHPEENITLNGKKYTFWKILVTPADSQNFGGSGFNVDRSDGVLVNVYLIPHKHSETKTNVLSMQGLALRINRASWNKKLSAYVVEAYHCDNYGDGG